MNAHLFGCAARRRAASGLLAAVLLAAASAKAGPGIWLAGDGSIQNPPKIEAVWGLFNLSVGLEFMGVSVETVIGHLMCTANFLPLCPSTDDEGRTFYSWKNSGNWDSIGLTIAHIKKVYDYLQDPLGILMDEIHGERNDEKGLDELTTAGPNRQTVTISFDDLPIVPDGVSVGVGTELRFDVNITGAHRVRVDQNAEIEKLTVGAGSTLLCDQGYSFRINNGLDNAGSVSGAISWIGGGLRNSGSFYAFTGGLGGGIENSGFFFGQGYYAGPIRNDGSIRSVNNGFMFDTNRVWGGGSFVNDTYAAFKNNSGSSPISVEQSIVSNGMLIFYDPFSVAAGAQVFARGYMYGEEISGQVTVQPGHTLRLDGRAAPAGRIVAEGADTALDYQVNNAGLVRVADGARLTTQDGDCDNSGTIEVVNAEMTVTNSWPPTAGYRTGMANTGAIRLDNSTLTFPAGLSVPTWCKHIGGDGTGIVRLENNSQVFNPAIVGNQVFIDDTSRATAGAGLACRLGNQVENRGEISVLGSLEMDGVLVNRGRIINNGTLTFGGNLTNDGEITSTGPMTLNVPALTGAGRVVSTDAVFLNHPGGVGHPVRVEQDFEPENYLAAATGLAIEAGRTVSSRGQWYVSRLSGDVAVRPGETLALHDGTILPDGRIHVAGAGTTLRLGVQNEGEVLVTDGGTMVTRELSCGNGGTIRAEDAALIFCVGIPWYGYQAEFPNTGAIQMTRSSLTFPGGAAALKYISGNGSIAARDHSTIADPVIAGPQVTIDATSRVVVTHPSYPVALRGAVRNEGEILLDGRFDAGGSWVNEGVIRSTGYGTFQGELVNDGLFHIAGGETTLDAPLLSGSGEIRSESSLRLRHSADPETPMHIAQPVSSSGFLAGETFFTTAPNQPVRASGRFFGKCGGEMRVHAGAALRVEQGDLPTGARIEATGNGTALELFSGTSRGEIAVRDGARLVTDAFSDRFINEGAVRLSDSAEAVLHSVPFWTSSDVFENRGQIHLDNASLTCAGKRIYGNGLISARNGSTLTNLETRGQPLIYLDSTSQLRFTSGYSGAIWGTLVSEGDVSLDNANVFIQGDWVLGSPLGGALSIAAPSAIWLAGDWSVRFRNPDDFDGRRATVRALGAPGGGWQQIEVGGIDFGSQADGWNGNFSLYQLVLEPGARVRLVDQYENADPAPEALYVDELILGDGAVLDRGTLGLYWNRLVGDPSQIIPEPTATAVWTVGAIFLRGCWRRRRLRQRPR